MRKTTLATITLLVLVSFLWSCQKESKIQTASPIVPSLSHSYINTRIMNVVNPVIIPDKSHIEIKNPFATVTTSSDVVISLGLVIFYDQTLSVTPVSNCNLCHRGKMAFADIRSGNKTVLGMNPMGDEGTDLTGVISSASIWADNGMPNSVATGTGIKSHKAMGVESMSILPAKMASKPYYRTLFKEAFGSDEITPERIVYALDQFMNEVPYHNSTESSFSDPFAR